MTQFCFPRKQKKGEKEEKGRRGEEGLRSAGAAGSQETAGRGHTQAERLYDKSSVGILGGKVAYLFQSSDRVTPYGHVKLAPIFSSA